MKKEVVKNGLETISNLRKPMLSWHKEVLNSYHNENNSLLYYDLIAGIWLEYFMHVVYAEWVQTRAMPDESYKVPILELTATPLEFTKLTASSFDYHLNLRMAIRSIQKGKKLTSCLRKTEDKITNGYFSQKPFIFSIRNVKYLLNKLLLRTISNGNAKVLICNPYFKVSRKEWVSVLWKWRYWVRYDNLDEYISVNVKYDYSWRYSMANQDKATDDFSCILKTLLPLCIPAVFLEGFKEFRAKTQLLNKTQPHIVYNATALDNHLTFKFLVAEWKKRNTVLLTHQHGGGYGIDYLHVLEDYEKRVSDYYYTWGWTTKDNKVRPLSVGLPDIKHNNYSKQILLNCNESSKYIYRLHVQPMPGNMETLICNTVDFVLLLPKHRNLLIRSYHHDRGWNFLERLKRAAPNAKYDTVGRRPRSFQRFAESRIVVHNSLGTSYLESLVLNIPTLCFFDPTTYEFRQDAKPYLEALEKVGILHRSGKDAASFLVYTWDSLEKWWQKEDVQKARSAFCDKYANFSHDWAQQWEYEFKRIISENFSNLW